MLLFNILLETTDDEGQSYYGVFYKLTFFKRIDETLFDMHRRPNENDTVWESLTLI